MTARNTYRRSMDGWWRSNPHFVKYIIREGTSLFFVIYAVILLIGLVALHRGEAAYQSWLSFVSHPLMVILHLIVLAAALYHTYTWFKISPKAAPPVYLGAKRVPDTILIVSQYAAMIVISIVIFAIVAWW